MCKFLKNNSQITKLFFIISFFLGTSNGAPPSKLIEEVKFLSPVFHFPKIYRYEITIFNSNSLPTKEYYSNKSGFFYLNRSTQYDTNNFITNISLFSKEGKYQEYIFDYQYLTNDKYLKTENLYLFTKNSKSIHSFEKKTLYQSGKVLWETTVYSRSKEYLTNYYSNSNLIAITNFKIYSDGDYSITSTLIEYQKNRIIKETFYKNFTNDFSPERKTVYFFEDSKTNKIIEYYHSDSKYIFSQSDKIRYYKDGRIKFIKFTGYEGISRHVREYHRYYKNKKKRRIRVSYSIFGGELRKYEFFNF